jgi:hypothetical protein
MKIDAVKAVLTCVNEILPLFSTFSFGLEENFGMEDVLVMPLNS